MSDTSNIMTSAEFRAMRRQENPARDITPQSNRKVCNAFRTECDGVVFASGIERFMHDLLRRHKIPFEFQKQYILQEAFVYNNERVCEITYTTDFWLYDNDMIVDTKGWQTQQGAMRIKMLKHELAMAGLRTHIALPRTKDECMALVRELLDKRQ